MKQLKDRRGLADVPNENVHSRRRLLQQIAALSVGAPLSQAQAMSMIHAPFTQKTEQQHTSPAPAPAPQALSPEDDGFLEQLEHANFLFFWEQSNPTTGLTKDRCNVRAKDSGIAASIASTGFGLTAICIGAKRGFVSYAEARSRVTQALSFLWHKLPTHRGFFYHFANINTGERIPLSSCRVLN